MTIWGSAKVNKVPFGVALPLSLTEGDKDNAADEDQMETAPSGSKRGADGEQRDDDKVMKEGRTVGRTVKQRAVP